ncbi:MAG: GEVED domain-containing protein [Pirellulales bacterium]
MRRLAIGLATLMVSIGSVAFGDYAADLEAQATHGGAVSGTDWGDAPGYGQAGFDEDTRVFLGSRWTHDTPGPGWIDDSDDGVSWSSSISPGSSFSLTVDINKVASWASDVRLNVWVDWDQDGVWSDSERAARLYHPPLNMGHNVFNLTANVPASALMGNTWMRAIVVYPDILDFHDDPISPYSSGWYSIWGEVEDYDVSVIPEPSTLAMLIGLGGLGLLGYLHRRRT